MKLFNLIRSLFLAFFLGILFVGFFGKAVLANCGFASVSFKGAFPDFVSQIPDYWKYEKDKGKSIFEAIEDCWSQPHLKKLHPMFQKVLQPCIFRTSKDPHFKTMVLYVKEDTLYRIRFDFKPGLNHEMVYKSLTEQNGLPDRETQFQIEKDHHELAGWKKGGCRMIYDFGGRNSAEPIFLFIDKLPLYPHGFNPTYLKLKFMD